MALTAALILVVLGLILLLVEVFLMPGTAVSGIMGLLCLVAGIVAGYNAGSVIGTSMLVGSLIVSGVLSVKFLNSDTWDKITIKTNIDSRTGEDDAVVSVGDEGKSITRLNPAGKARINDAYLEVTARNSYIDHDTPVKVVKKEGRRIFVEPVLKT